MRLGAGLRLLLATGMLLVVTGCRHTVKVATVPLPPATTVPLVPAPEPATPPRLPQEPVSPAPLPTQPVQPKVKKPKKKIEAPPPPPAPVVVASVAPPPDASVIGALSAGGDAAPAQQQKASDAIGEVEKRLAGLSAETLKNQEQGIIRVRNFLRQSREALNSGDAQGSITLATKAKVLLDDLLK